MPELLIQKESVRNNIFVSDILGGIDDINYSGIADKVTYDYVMSLDNIPEGFHQITITFKADDYVAGTKVIAYNGNITTSDLPSIPKKDGDVRMAADITVSPITQNKVVEAEYHLWTESLASNEKMQMAKYYSLQKASSTTMTSL